MKKTYKFITSASLALLVLGLYAPAVNAVDSEAKIEFKQPEEAPAILNPEDPDNPLNPLPDKPSGQAGVLTLDYVSNFNFGTQELSAEKETYNAVNELTPFAQVTDVRGTGKGWKLTAQFKGFRQDEERSLKGSTITLTNGDVVSREDTMLMDNNKPEITSGEIKLSDGGQVTDITVADDGKGKGTWLTRWQDNENNNAGNDNVRLTVPAAVATIGDHTGTITWTLYNAPDGTEQESLYDPNES